MQVFFWACFGVLCCSAPDSPYHLTYEKAYERLTLRDTLLPIFDPTIRAMVYKFATPANDKGKKNEHYNEAFARIIDSMEHSVDLFEYVFDPSGESGKIEYSNGRIKIHIIKASKAFGTLIPEEGILFEETCHVKQFLKGQTHFEWDGTGWKPAANIWLEVDAKLFAATELGTEVLYYKGDRTLITELCYLRCVLQNDTARADYLINGGDCKYCMPGIINGRKYWADTAGLYPTWGYQDIIDTCTARRSNNHILAYPRRTPLKIPIYYSSPEGVLVCPKGLSW